MWLRTGLSLFDLTAGLHGARLSVSQGRSMGLLRGNSLLRCPLAWYNCSANSPHLCRAIYQQQSIPQVLLLKVPFYAFLLLLLLLLTATTTTTAAAADSVSPAPAPPAPAPLHCHRHRRHRGTATTAAAATVVREHFICVMTSGIAHVIAILTAER